MSTPPLAETSLGGCFLGTDLVKCAWTPSECPNLTFLSATEKLGSSRCDKEVDELIGLCVEETMCTTDANNCKNPSSFIPEFPFCNVRYNRYKDKMEGTQFSLWGKCRMVVDGVDENTCVWSAAECPGTFTTPFDNNYYAADPSKGLDVKSDDICTCEFTKVGACLADDGYHCAVSPSSCGIESTYVDWMNLAPDIDCRICEPFAHKTRVAGDDFVYGFGRIPPEEWNRSLDSFLFTLLGFGIGVLILGGTWFGCTKMKYGVRT